jgi:ureidoacrylate peracid hydrolase
VALRAKPDALDLDLSKTAVIVVDMQNDFASNGGMLGRAGMDISMIQRGVPSIARVLAAARKVGISIIYLKMAYLPDLSDLGPQGSPNWILHTKVHVGERVQSPAGAESRILIRDTWNTDIIDELRPERNDTVLYKTRFSGFYRTELNKRLKSCRAQYLIITGCTTSVCVESTIRDAMFRDYSPVLLADCSSELVGHRLPRSNHEATLLLVQERFGWVSTSDDFIKALQAATSSA